MIIKFEGKYLSRQTCFNVKHYFLLMATIAAIKHVNLHFFCYFTVKEYVLNLQNWRGFKHVSKVTLQELS